MDIVDHVSWQVVQSEAREQETIQVVCRCFSSTQKPLRITIFCTLLGLIKLHLQSSDEDAAPTKKLKTAAAGDLKRRFPMQGNRLDAANNMAWIGSALDPRFKALTFLPDTLRRAVWVEVKSRVDTQKRETEVTQPHTKAKASGPGDTSAKGSALQLLLGTSGAKERIDEQHEVDRYQAEAKAADNISPLTWWKMNGHRFPHMQQLARAVLVIPATSTPAERLFSAAGLVCSKKRSGLSAEHVDMLVFLHQKRNY